MHLVDFKYEKTVEFLRTVCKIKHTTLNDFDQSLSSLHEVTWIFTLNYFDRELSREMLNYFLKMSDSPNFQFKISPFLNGITHFHCTHFQSFLSLINETFCKEKVQAILQNQGLDIFKCTDIITESKSRSTEDLKEFLYFVYRNYRSEVKKVLTQIIKSYSFNITLFAKLINSLDDPTLNQEKKELYIDFMDNVHNSSDLLTLWTNGLHFFIKETSDIQLLQRFIEKLIKSSQDYECLTIINDYIKQDRVDGYKEKHTDIFFEKMFHSIFKKIILEDSKNIYLKFFNISVILFSELNDIALNVCFEIINECQKDFTVVYERVMCFAKVFNDENSITEIFDSLPVIDDKLFNTSWETLKCLKDEKCTLKVISQFKKYQNQEKFPIINLIFMKVKPNDFLEFLGRSCENIVGPMNFENFFFKMFKFSDLIRLHSLNDAYSENFFNFILFLKMKLNYADIEARILRLIKEYMDVEKSINITNFSLFLNNLFAKSVVHTDVFRWICGYLSSIDFEKCLHLILSSEIKVESNFYDTSEIKFESKYFYDTIKSLNQCEIIKPHSFSITDRFYVLKFHFLIIIDEISKDNTKFINEVMFLKKLFNENEEIEECYEECYLMSHKRT